MQPAPGVETVTVNWLATLGVGGILAALMFLLYRRDIKSYTELWKGQSDVLLQIVKENTESNVELKALIETKINGSNPSEVKDLKELVKNQIDKIERLEGQIRHMRPAGR